MTSSKSFSNLQLELLEIFKFELSETQLREIRAILANYFASMVDTEIDKIFIEKNWDESKIEEWANGHFRSKPISKE